MAEIRLQDVIELYAFNDRHDRPHLAITIHSGLGPATVILDAERAMQLFGLLVAILARAPKSRLLDYPPDG